jgi:uncharacterized protein (DUF58 family)
VDRAQVGRWCSDLVRIAFGGGRFSSATNAVRLSSRNERVARDRDVAATPWLDLPTLMAIQSLELRVRRLVQGVQRGIHRSVRRGYSNEFSEYRPYVPGDDLRHMDWRRMARTDRPYVRQYEDDSEWRCIVVADLSASMAFGSLSYSKADYARTLAGTLGAFLYGQGDAVGLLRFADGVGEAVPVRHAQRQMSRWWHLLAAPPSGEATELGSALQCAQQLMRRAGLVVVVSDFLASLDFLGESLGVLSAAGHQVVLFEVLDPQEIQFSFEGNTRFEMLEGGRVVDVDAAQVRHGYLERMRVHRELLKTTAAEHGALLFESVTSIPLEPLLRSALAGIAKRRFGPGSAVSP